METPPGTANVHGRSLRPAAPAKLGTGWGGATQRSPCPVEGRCVQLLSCGNWGQERRRRRRRTQETPGEAGSRPFAA